MFVLIRLSFRLKLTSTSTHRRLAKIPIPFELHSVDIHIALPSGSVLGGTYYVSQEDDVKNYIINVLIFL